MSDIAIEIRGLRKTFGDFTAVADIDLPVLTGEVFGFLGPNGAGKTTTIGMLLGLIHPTAGTIKVLGKTVTPHKTQVLKRVGALMGAPAFVPYLSAEKNLKLVAKLYPQVDQKRINAVIELVNLDHAGKRKAAKFSMGMKQRLGLAAALLHKPDLVILDEPSSGLDPNGQREFRTVIRRLADQGVTVFLSSHGLAEVEAICDRVAVLNAGKIVALDAVATLLATDPAVDMRFADVVSAEKALSTLPNVSITINDNNLNIRGASSEAILSTLFAHAVVPTTFTPLTNKLEDLFASLTHAV